MASYFMDSQFMWLDLPALLIAMLSAACCSTLGNFLVLKKQAMMGDALSHCVLPGLVVGYLLSGSLAPPVMLAGAGGACLLAVLCVKGLEIYGRVPSSAALAIILSSFFALGVFLLETQVGGRVHLDTQHALYGALELIYWPDAPRFSTMPMPIKMLGVICALVALGTALLFKEIQLVLFDQEFADVGGFRPKLISTLILSAVAMALVACFDVVGVILVIALLICPAACARMFCDNLKTQIVSSVVIGVSAAVLGYFLAAKVPLWLGMEHSLGAAGMIAVVLGIMQVLAMLFAPQYGALRQHNR